MDKFKTLKDHVYDYIAEQILEGNLEPEEKINEQVICEELGISRTPVREALIQLSSEGVLENVARKGFVVRSLSEKEVQELYKVIGLLDGYAASLACGKLDEKDLANMRFYMDSMDLAIKAGNFEMYHVQQLAFHDVYMKKCDNDVLVETIDRLKSKILKKSYVDDPSGETRKVLSATNREHEKILELFEANKADELVHYLMDVHWASHYAGYDSLQG